MRIAYAPYAPEAYFENFFSVGGKLLYFYFKGGMRSFGAGFGYDHFFSGKRGSIGFRLDGWNQNVFVSSATVGELEREEDVFRPVLNKRRWGAALLTRSTLNIFSHLALFTEIGGKTSDYLPGYGLDKEIGGRVGLTFSRNSLRQKIEDKDKLNVE